MFGADASYPRAGEWQINVSARALRSTDHYSRDIEQHERQTLGTYVVNLQRALDVNVGYQASERIALSAGVPYIAASWSIPSPRAPVLGPRANENAQGIGDITVGARTWLFSPKTSRNGNIAIGMGVKMPTGKSDAQDYFPDIEGRNNQLRYVDQSVQPGDSGWGITTDISAFRRIKGVTVFGSGSYLINPKNTNDTPSILISLGIPNFNLDAPNNRNRLVNSVPDQYVARVGGMTALGKGFGASLAWRIEGLRRYDLIGRSDGFRRPGLEMFVEPGVSFQWGNNNLSLNVPIGYYRNRKPDPYTGAFGDATFPKYIVLANYSLRLGKGSKAAKPIQLNQSGSNTAAGVPLPDPAVRPGEQFVRLNVTGMTCDHCADSVRTALQGVKGVTDVKVSLATNQAIVTYRPADAGLEDLIQAVKKTKGMNPYSAEIHQR